MTKDPETGRLLWVIQVDPKCNHESLYMMEVEEDFTLHPEESVEGQAETGVCSHKPRVAGSLRAGGSITPGDQESRSCGFQLTGLQSCEDTSLSFQASNFVVIYFTAASENYPPGSEQIVPILQATPASGLSQDHGQRASLFPGGAVLSLALHPSPHRPTLCSIQQVIEQLQCARRCAKYRAAEGKMSRNS